MAAAQKLILVVEDEALLALDIVLMLERHGWKVQGPAFTVAEALALLEQDKPDLVLLDVQLDDQLSAPVAEALRARNVGLVLISAYAHPEQLAPTFAGIPNIGKPVSERRLIHTVERLLT